MMVRTSMMTVMAMIIAMLLVLAMSDERRVSTENEERGTVVMMLAGFAV